MSRMMKASLAFVASFGAATASNVETNPISKVTMLLDNLQSKLIKDGQAEQAAYYKYADWCQNGAKDLEYGIKTGKSSIEDLSATIDKASADVSTMSSKIEDLASSLASNDADLKAATEIREKENTEFSVAETELVDAVDTLERAINVLARKMHGSAMLQTKVPKGNVKAMVTALSALVDAASFSIHDKQKLIGLVQSSEDSVDEEDDMGAPAAAAYESHGEGIVDVLEDLKQKAVSQLDELRREEVNARHNFELMKQSIEDELNVDTKDMTESKTVKLEATETKAVAEGDLEKTQKDLANDENVLKNMKSECQTKSNDHEQTIKSRQEEMDALKAATAAIKEATGGASSIVYSASLLQIHGSGKDVGASHLRTRVDLVNFEVVNLVRKLAREQKSAMLAQLAGRISAVEREGSTASADPFSKIKDMINDMIVRLQKEAGDEATHKAYCDKEYATTKQKLAELKYDIEKHSSKIDQDKANSALLKDEVTALSGEIAQIVKSQADGDAVRKEEHAVYVESKADLESGLEGIRMALKILREYYSSQADASLLQQPAAPELHSKASGSGTSIVGMLEVVESDIGKNLASTEMNEDAGAVAYQRLSMDNKVTKAMKEQDVKYKTKEAAGLDKSVAELTSDRDSQQTELDAVLEYSVNIRGMCELKPETYEERSGRRQAEISGLREALQVLEGESVFLQRTTRQKGARGLRGTLSA